MLPTLLDPYERPARLYPALLVLAPLAVTIVCGHRLGNSVLPAAISMLGLCGASYALARVARDAGKRLQDGLFAKWGGAPTTQLLRHRDVHFDTHTKDRFHRILAQGMGVSMPTYDEERKNPTAADDKYRAATVWLINHTRDRKTFPLLFKENVAFGFHRNALGLKPLGILVAFACLAWAILMRLGPSVLKPPHHLGLTMPQLPGILALVSCALLLIYWTSFVSGHATRRAAFSYAERLLQCCDQLVRDQR